MEKVIKIILAVLFFICLLKMPYGYFQAVRIAALAGFLILAYQSYKTDNKILMIIFICLAILFQPIIKITLGRIIWNIVDVIVGILLIVSIFFKPKHDRTP